MSTAVNLTGSTDTKWTVISGAMTGTVRLMTADRFTIGRSPDNEFVIINDPKCSRKHASVCWTEFGCEISALNEANPIQLNGKDIARAILNDADILTLGETKIQFNLTNGTANVPSQYTSGHTEVALVEPLPPVARNSAQPAVPRHRSSSSSRSAKKKSSNKGRLYLYGGIGLVVLFFLYPSKKKPEKIALRTEQQIQADIDAANAIAEKAVKNPVNRFDASLTARQAQENYVRGFRDFRRGQYERSLDSFQACLALDPQHSLCNRYLRLAQRKFNEIVQYDIILGRKYRDQNQFKSCRSAFRNVMVMVKDANSAAYKEAKANFDACSAMLEGRF